MSQTGHSATDFVEVHDEPLHRVQFRNDYVVIYTVDIPLGVTTLWHRHREDTVYCAIRAVTVAEWLPEDTAPCVRQLPGGSAISRAHKAEPLIHQITNTGDDVVQFVAAEAHARPATVQPRALIARGHEFAWDAPRFRVYRVLTTAKDLVADYAFHALFVALAPTTVTIERADPAAITHQALEPGGWVWLEPGVHLRYAPATRGILAEWR